LTKPKRWIDFAICASCFLEWLRALCAAGRSSAGERYSIRRLSNRVALGETDSLAAEDAHTVASDDAFSPTSLAPLATTMSRALFLT
jgi:hypothetical protein